MTTLRMMLLYFEGTLLEQLRGYYRKEGPCKDCITEKVSPLVLLPLALEKWIYKPDRHRVDHSSTIPPVTILL